MEPLDQQPQAADTSPVPQATAAAAPVPPSSPGPVPQPAKRSRGKGYWRWYSAAALLAVAVTSGAMVSTKTEGTANAAPAVAVSESGATPSTNSGSVDSPSATSTPPTTSAPTTTTVDEPTLLDASAVGASVIRSVVTVQISGTAVNGQEGPVGSGSGVVYDNLGHIITNDHVVAAGTSFEIVLSDGRVYPAELVGTDPTTDLAVLSITAQDLAAIALGNSDVLSVGDPAVAVGSPLGLDGGPSLTVGVISAFGRLVQTDATTRLYGMLQTDAPITSGSSGGALVDGAGQLIGITTAVGVSDVGIEGIGFATPVEVVTRVANEIIEGGTASAAYIGIRGDTSFADTTDGGSAPTGVVVVSVEPGTAAATAGIAADDVIAAINGDTVKTMNELVALLRRYGAGEMIEVTLDNGTLVDVTLGQVPAA